MVDESEGRVAPAWCRLFGGFWILCGVLIAVVSNVHPFKALRSVEYDVTKLPPHWLSGYWMVAISGVLFALAGASIYRGSWWAAAGRFVAAIFLAYCGVGLVRA